MVEIHGKYQDLQSLRGDTMPTIFDWCMLGFMLSGPVIMGVYVVIYWIRSELQYKREMRVINNRNMERLYEDCLKRMERLK